MRIKTLLIALAAVLLTAGLVAGPVTVTSVKPDGSAVTALGVAPDQALAQSGLIKNNATHAVIVHTSIGNYYWLYYGQYRSDVDRWRPDQGWQMAWHFAGEYTEHYTSCNSGPPWTNCYSYNSFRDVVIDNGWPL